MIDCTPQALVSAAKCFRCMTGMHWAVRSYLLCQWANGQSATCDPNDPHYLDFIAKTQITDPARQAAVCRLVYDLKNLPTPANNYWDREDAIYPMVFDNVDIPFRSIAYSYNLKNTGTFQLTYSGSGLTFSDLGIGGNGTAGYVNTNYAVTDLTNIRAMCYVHTADTTGTSRYYLGAANPSAPFDLFSIRMNNAAKPFGFSVNSETNSLPFANVAALGAYMTQRIDANNQMGTYPGLGSWASAAVAVSGLSTRSLFLLALNSGSASTWSNAEISSVSIGGALDVGGGYAEAAQYKAIWDRFQAAVNPLRAHP